MAFTQKTYVVEGATLDVDVRHGRARAVISVLRKKRGGDWEEMRLEISELTAEELACVGRTARVSIWNMRQQIDKRLQGAYDRVITPGS